MKRTSFGLRFRPRRAEQNRLPFDISSKVRVAQISGVPVIDRAVAFLPQEWPNLESFRPGVLIGHAAALKSLSEQLRTDRLDLASIDHAVFVLTDCGKPPVNDTLRVLFWQTFGVPVYELVAAADGNMLAADCEAQEGWHLQPGVRARLLNRELIFETANVKDLRSGVTAELVSDPCACGRTALKVVNVERLRRPASIQRLAATA